MTSHYPFGISYQASSLLLVILSSVNHLFDLSHRISSALEFSDNRKPIQSLRFPLIYLLGDLLPYTFLELRSHLLYNDIDQSFIDSFLQQFPFDHIERFTLSDDLTTHIQPRILEIVHIVLLHKNHDHIDDLFFVVSFLSELEGELVLSLGIAVDILERIVETRRHNSKQTINMPLYTKFNQLFQPTKNRPNQDDTRLDCNRSGMYIRNV